MNLTDFVASVPTAEQLALIADFSTSFQFLAGQIEHNVPNSAHRTSALRKLLEAKMTLIHGITHDVSR